MEGDHRGADEGAMEPETWANPTSHFRARHRLLSLYGDRDALVGKLLNFKTWALDRWYVPWFSPVYFVVTHFSQRNRNLFLLENHLNYRPYKFRRNDETSKY